MSASSFSRPLRDMHYEGVALTAIEQQTLRRVARGLTRHEIAADLGKGPETVKTHMRVILAKLGARNAPQAVAIAMSHDLI